MIPFISLYLPLSPLSVEIRPFKTSKEKIWPLLVIPKVVGKTREIIRSVVRIIYEEKKPEIEVSTVEQSKDKEPTKVKTDEATFKSSMPNGFADLFIPVMDQWVSDGFTFSWGVTGFSIRSVWAGKKRSIVDIYPTYISLMTEEMIKRRKLTDFKAYHDYRKVIDNIPLVRRYFSENRTNIKFIPT